MKANESKAKENEAKESEAITDKSICGFDYDKERIIKAYQEAISNKAKFKVLTFEISEDRAYLICAEKTDFAVWIRTDWASREKKEGNPKGIARETRETDYLSNETIKAIYDFSKLPLKNEDIKDVRA